MDAVSVEGVWKYFGDFPALRDVTIRAERGSCLALIGRNGAGKTTLLRILAGLSSPAKGRISVFGGGAREQSTRRKIGYLGHGIGIYDELSAFENLRLFAKLYGVADASGRAKTWLERVGLGHVHEGLPREFSRGMRQRLAVARAFLHEPDLMILDEPFTALDDRAIAVLQEILKRAMSDGRTVIMSTHQLREALELATDVALINRGKLAFAGKRSQAMLDDSGWLYRNYGEA
ncbi:MAG TPA: heme ABC exporter ATP-binding protein CcmA [Bryobacteraceae bacterium]|nr:heme ABC exporter ATP-binding protein CcmA [Bryobacteraceae bacterium]